MTASDMVRVLVVGAGGHARVCIEALADSGFDVVGCVSRDGSGISGLPCRVLGGDEELEQIAERIDVRRVFVAVGHNATRELLTARCREAGLAPVNAISRFAMVSAAAELGSGVAVLAGAVLNPSAIVADGAILNTRCSIDHDVYIGPFAHVAVGVAVAGGVTVGERALLGVGSCVVPLARIGADAVVGAGAAVVRDVAAGTTVMGVPARERGAR
ncbi:MAG: NeuD/PglB/VioB family sugar acetyltransferase [Actinomycetota bacterium]|nr:NeuD/PglB/VioB family sugar acetyltransferase [Actinomycetota bacterium]